MPAMAGNPATSPIARRQRAAHLRPPLHYNGSMGTSGPPDAPTGEAAPTVVGEAAPTVADKPTSRRPADRVAATALGPGSHVGRYIVLEQIGEGGMGVVYKAHDPELDRRIALKLVRVERTDELHAEGSRVRLLREAQALARLSHPNVIAIHDAGRFGDDVFLAMELVEGQSLRKS